MALAHELTLAPSSEPPLRRKIAAILAADVAGYSRMVAEAEEDTLRQLAAAREIFDGLVERAGGRIFNTAGDSVMCEFDSAVEAVRAAIDIQSSLAAHNSSRPPARRLEFRMGLTIGDVVERNGDLLGDGVNIASRLEGLAAPGGICVSRSVHEAVSNKVQVSFRDLGERQVKNIPGSIHAFLIEPPGLPADIALEFVPLTPLHASRPGRRSASPTASGRRIAVASAAVLLALGAAWPGYQAARNALAPAVRPASNLASTSPDAVGSAPPALKPSVTPATPVPAAPSPVPGPSSGAAKPAAKPRSADKPALPTDPVAALASLSKEGILPEPNTVAELYHNARLQEAKDRPAALRSYAALTARSAEFLDADLRYAALLRAANGIAAARNTFAELARSSGANAAALAAATQAEPGERRGRLEALASSVPDFAPVSYILAEDYLSDRPGGPTLTERRLAYDALNTFLEASATPKAAAAFLERSVLNSWREAAQKRQAEIEAGFAGAKTRPAAAFTRSETGWTATVSLPEPALGVAYRLGEQGEARSTGLSSSDDPRTGKPAPRTQFEIPLAQGRTTIYLTYTDDAGHLAGPFPVPFDPAASLIASERDTLERFPESWVTFRPDLPDTASVTQLVSNRCAISRALIGFGDAPPKDRLPLPPCNEQNPYAIPPDARAILNLPADIDVVRVQLSYADGTESPVRTFRRP